MYKCENIYCNWIGDNPKEVKIYADGVQVFLFSPYISKSELLDDNVILICPECGYFVLKED